MFDSMHKRYHYRGLSMFPTLRSKDVLHVEPYGTRPIRRGDVVVFEVSGTHAITFVHRVIRLGSEGIVTQGDNNPLPDTGFLQPCAIAGRVIAASDGRRRRSIPGGFYGIVQHDALISLRAIAAFLLRLTSPLYRELVRLRVLPLTCFSSMFQPRIYCFHTPEGEELHLHLGRMFVGRCVSGSTTWRIRPPFMLFVDVASLPLPTRSDATIPPDECFPC